jgi:ABC-type multidrug transport system fused ATPase/permease subunit
MQISRVLQALVSVRRIGSFLAEPEVADWACALKRNEEGSPSSGAVGFRAASFRWHRNAKVDDVLEATEGARSVYSEVNGGAFVLRELDCVFPSGRLTLVAGPVGSGKSSLLSALLGGG